MAIRASLATAARGRDLAGYLSASEPGSAGVRGTGGGNRVLKPLADPHRERPTVALGERSGCVRCGETR